MPQSETILEAAARLTSGERREQYGPVHRECEMVAELWSALLKKKLIEPISPHEYSLCMMLMKISRYHYGNNRDCLIDIPGYARVLELLDEPPKPIWEKMADVRDRVSETHHDMNPVELVGPEKLAELAGAKPLTWLQSNKLADAMRKAEKTINADQIVIPDNIKALEVSNLYGPINNVSQSAIREPRIADMSGQQFIGMAHALNDPHLDMAAAFSPGAAKYIKEMRDSAALYIQEYDLDNFQAPEVQVIFDGKLVVIPGVVRSYANSLQQNYYVAFLSKLFSPDEMQLLKKRVDKANMGITPALWLNQALWVELSKGIAEEIPMGREAAFTAMHLYNLYERLEACMGKPLFDELVLAARAKNISPVTAFIHLFTKVIQPPERPSVGASIWGSCPKSPAPTPAVRVEMTLVEEDPVRAEIIGRQYSQVLEGINEQPGYAEWSMYNKPVPYKSKSTGESGFSKKPGG